MVALGRAYLDLDASPLKGTSTILSLASSPNHRSQAFMTAFGNKTEHFFWS